MRRFGLSKDAIIEAALYDTVRDWGQQQSGGAKKWCLFVCVGTPV